MAVEPGSSDEVARLLAVLIRIQLPTQADSIRELGKIGLGPKRIAELLGTTANTVGVTLAKAKEQCVKMQSRTKIPELDDLVRLCNESVVLQALAFRRSCENKLEFTVTLSQAGFSNARIAEFLGESTASVRSAVNRAKKNRG